MSLLGWEYAKSFGWRAGVTHVHGNGGKKVVTLRYEPERVAEVCEG